MSILSALFSSRPVFLVSFLLLFLVFLADAILCVRAERRVGRRWWLRLPLGGFVALAKFGLRIVVLTLFFFMFAVMAQGQGVIIAPQYPPLPDAPVPKPAASEPFAPNKEKCSTHDRQLKKPWTWLESNMCDADYQAWVRPRLGDRWYKDKTWWAGETLGVLLPLALDADSTIRNQSQGCIESNPLLGSHPSNAKIIGVTVVGAGIQTTLYWLSYRLSHNDPSRTWRIIGQLGVPAAVWSTNGRSAINNYQLHCGGR